MMRDVGRSSADWIRALEREPAAPRPARSEVVLTGYPVVLGLRYREHMAEVFRELQMIAGLRTADGEEGAGGTPARLVALARDIAERYGDQLAGPHEHTERAAAQGIDHIDLRYPLTRDSRELALHFARVMEEVDQYCRDEALITLQPSLAMYGLRRWSIEEFVRQYDGHEPRPYPGPPAAAGDHFGGASSGTRS